MGRDDVTQSENLLVFVFPPKAEMENWTLFAERLLLQWRVLTENKPIFKKCN